MAEPTKGPSGTNDETGSGARRGPAPLDPLRVTRRTVLTGIASTAVPVAAHAADAPTVSVDYGDEDRRSLVIVFDHHQGPEGRRELRLPASFLGDTDPPDPRQAARFVRTRTGTGWHAIVEHASFPGGPPFAFEMDVGWTPAPAGRGSGGTVRIRLSLPFGTVTIGTGGPGAATTLEDWLFATADVAGVVDARLAARLASSLAGGSLDVGRSKTFRLALCRDGYWSLRGAAPMQALPAEALALGMDHVIFAPPSSDVGLRSGKGNGSAFLLEPRPGSPTGARGDEIRNLFEGQGAPPPVDPKKASTRRVLYVLGKGVTAAGRFDAGTNGRAAADLRVTGSDQVMPAVAWRNDGDRRPVMAARLDMEASITGPSGRTVLPPGVARLWRVGEAADARFAAALEPKALETKPFDLATRFGTFTVCALPASAERPGVPAQVPAFRLASVGGDHAKRRLTQFEAPVRLLRTSIGLSQAEGALSLLSFDEAQCLFVLGGVSLNHAWDGVARNGTEPPQAEAIVDIGDAPDDRPPVRLSLSGASLAVRRPSDLLSLTFRFRDLVLERDAAPEGDTPRWWIVPDRRSAAPRRSGERIEEGVASACGAPRPAGTSARWYAEAADPRPLLVVGFPPQHVAERAFFRQFKADPVLPAPPVPICTEDADLMLDGSTGDDRDGDHALQRRIDSRKRVQAKQVGDADFDGFVKAFADAAQNAGLDPDQCIYVGPRFLDPKAARVARAIATAREPGLGDPAGWTSKDKFEQALRMLPEVDLEPGETSDLRAQFGLPSKPTDQETEDDENSSTAMGAYVRAREERKDRNDPDYAAFRAFYLTKFDPVNKTCPTGAAMLVAAPVGPCMPHYAGRRSYVDWILRTLTAAQRAAAIQGIRAVVEAYNAHASRLNADTFTIPAEARASGPSRLAFRIPTDDFEGGRPDADGRPAGALPFTIAALTNWGSLDLSVVRRVEKLFDPLPGGLAARRWERGESQDASALLVFQGLSAGDAWSRRGIDLPTGCATPMPARSGRVTGAQRMAEVVAQAREPAWYETAVELPFRLMLSPAQDATWRTPLPVADPRLARDPASPIPLWTARLEEVPGTSSVRAVWSPDFRPEALLEGEIGTPPHGPFAPWAMPRDVTTRQPFGAGETPERFRTSLDAGDRHELVLMSSLHGLPVRGRRRADGRLADSSQFEPPHGFALRDAAPEALADGAARADWSAIYRPQAIGVTELALSALGGTLDADTGFTPPASAKTIPAWARFLPDALRTPRSLFDAPSIERWRQLTVLGRDVSVEVVYKGYLFPLGHRASLVKLTERRFLASTRGAPPTAYLVQRFFLRVASPAKRYPAILQPNGSRRWPVEILEILTKTTPDLLDPTDASKTAGQLVEAANGRLFLNAGLAFWPRVRPGPGGDVRFEFQVDRRGGRINMPLVFLDNTAANDAASVKQLVDYYNALHKDREPGQTDQPDRVADARRVMRHGGAKRRYAPERQPDDTSLETISWDVAAEGSESKAAETAPGWRFFNDDYDFSPLKQGDDQPPFYPVLERASVRIAQVDRLVGSASAPVTVRFDPDFTLSGFAEEAADGSTARPDVYLDFQRAVALDPGASGDRTGGATRPNTKLVALSRSRGPVGAQAAIPETPPKDGVSSAQVPQQSLAGSFKAPNVGDFFDADAKILGILSFKDALKLLEGGLASTPAFKEITQYTSALLADASQAEQDVGAVVARVRDALLVPLREALRSFSAEWKAALDGAKAGTDDAGGGDETRVVDRLVVIYPDVGTGYRDMQVALDEALSASTAVRDVADLYAHFAAIYAAGRRFVAAIERVAADPIAPVRAALRAAVMQELSALQSDVDVVTAVGAGLPAQLEALPTAAHDAIAGLVAAPALAAWRRLVFALPVARADSGDAAAQAAVRTAVDEDLATALQTDWVGSLASKGRADAAKAIAGALRKALGERADPAVAAALADWDESSLDDEGKLAGLLFRSTMEALKGVLDEARSLATSAEALAANEARRQLGRMAVNLLALARPLVDDLSLKARGLCVSGLAVLRATAAAVAPSLDEALRPKALAVRLVAAADASRKLVSALEDYRQIALATPGEAAAAEDATKLLEAIRAPSDLFNKLGSQVSRAALALDQAAGQYASAAQGGLSDALCTRLDPTTLSRLPLDALSGLGLRRAALLGDLPSLLGNASTLASTVGAPSGLFVILQIKDDEISTNPGTDLDGLRVRAAQAARVLLQRLVAVAGDLGRFARAATSLKASDLQWTALHDAVNGLARLIGPGQASLGPRIAGDLSKAATALETLARQKALEVSARVIEPLADLSGRPLATVGEIMGAATSLATLSQSATDALNDVAAGVENAERILLDGAAGCLVAADGVGDEIAARSLGLLKGVASALATLQKIIVAERKKAYDALASGGGGGGGTDAKSVLQDVGRAAGADMARLLLVARPSEARAASAADAGDADPTGPDSDFLAHEARELEAVRTLPATAALATILPLLDDWSKGRASAALLVDAMRRAAEQVLSGNLKGIVDLEGARRRIEAKLKEMVPSRVSLSYDFSAEMVPVAGLFLPQGDKRLTIGVAASYDLLSPDKPPTFVATTTLSAFDVNLFDVVTLLFDGARFANDSAKGSDFKVAYKDFRLGPEAAFIEPLQAYLNPKGSGPYVRAAGTSPGIEAGYSLFIGIVPIGSLSFTNVSLNAACVLPFDDREAKFSASIGRRDKPFLISALPYTGGGFLTLTANSRRIVGFEASFEFGGGGAFQFGPLSGQGRITTGIYVSKVEVPQGPQGVTIEGFFYAGGEAHVACFGVSATLLVRISQQPGGSMQGVATFTFSFSLGFADVTYSVRVGKQIGSGFSSGTSASLAADRIRFADMSYSDATTIPKGRGAIVRSLAESQDADWARYRSYFADDIDGFPA